MTRRERRGSAINGGMRPFRIQSWAAAVSLAGACTLAGPASAPAAPNRAALDYVALGDSYSAGVGAGDYLPEGASCLRSSRAYPALWASTHASSFAFAACNGAKTGDVLNKQLGALSGRTNLVSVTAGGSDASWAKVMGICALPGTKACLNAIDTARAYVDKTLPANLDRLYSGIRARRRAPASWCSAIRTSTSSTAPARGGSRTRSGRRSTRPSTTSTA